MMWLSYVVYTNHFSCYLKRWIVLSRAGYYYEMFKYFNEIIKGQGKIFFNFFISNFVINDNTYLTRW